MIYGYPTVVNFPTLLCIDRDFDQKFDLVLLFVAQENDYHGGIFLPMYDQTNAQLPANAQPTDHNPNTSDYRRNCGIPLAFFEPQTQGNTHKHIHTITILQFLFI